MSDEVKSSHQSSTRMDGIDKRLNNQRDDASARFDRIDQRMDADHKEVIDNFKEIFAGISMIKTNCSGCSTRIEINTGRLNNLDDLKNGAVVKLQQEMVSLRTKVALYVAAGSAIVFGAYKVIRSTFFGK